MMAQRWTNRRWATIVMMIHAITFTLTVMIRRCITVIICRTVIVITECDGAEREINSYDRSRMEYKWRHTKIGREKKKKKKWKIVES